MRFSVDDHQFLAFFPPYKTIDIIDHPSQFPVSHVPLRGGALFWNLRVGHWGAGFRAVRSRPPGVALFLLLPPVTELEGTEKLLDLMEHCRPHSILPFLRELDPEEIVPILRRFPSEFAAEVTDYLVWRGIEVDLDTRRLIRKTLDLSGELRTVTALARALYMSRRALGRRFMTRGLPVPSHWIHFGRVLRAALHLQKNDANLYSVACRLGYPDGFSLSNQMMRLTNLRPSLLRECFGWEWIVEAWLHKEALAGNLSPLLRENLFGEDRGGDESSRVPEPQPMTPHHLSLRVAEDTQFKGCERSSSGPF